MKVLSKLRKWMFHYEYTKHLCWICGGRDTENIWVCHRYVLGKERSRKLLYEEPKEVLITDGEQLTTGLSSSIDICTKGKAIVTGKRTLESLYKKLISIHKANLNFLRYVPIINLFLTGYEKAVDDLEKAVEGESKEEGK